MKLPVGVILMGGALGATLANSHSAEASCELEYCTLPRSEVTKDPEPSTIRMQTRIRHVEFSLPEGQGSYQESIISVAIRPIAKCIAQLSNSSGRWRKIGGYGRVDKYLQSIQ